MSSLRSLRHRLLGESRWIPWSFVGLFGVVLLANGIMVGVAFDSWTGLVEHNYYRRGLAYNEALAAARAQDELGWQVEVSPQNEHAGALVLLLSLADADSRAMAADRIVARLERPTSAAFDRELAFAELQRGRYAASVEDLEPGVWDLRLVLHKGRDSHETVQRLTVK